MPAAARALPVRHPSPRATPFSAGIPAASPTRTHRPRSARRTGIAGQLAQPPLAPAAATTRMPPPPPAAAAALSPASRADVTLSSWFLEDAQTDDAVAARAASGADAGPPRRLAAIVLNHALPPSLTPTLLARADLVICADGGANRLYDAAPGWGGVGADSPDAARDRFLPTAIVGDLDSLSPAVSAFYKARGVPVVDASADQDSTDLDKALSYILRTVTGGGGAWADTTVVALGALGGRLDHTLSALNALFKPVGGGAGDSPTAVWAPNLVLVGDGSLARAVPAAAGGVVAIEPAAVEAAGACGLVALGGPVRARTAGLAWDLKGGEGGNTLCVGGLQSTSNRVVGRGRGGQPRVVVEVVSGGGGGDGRLVWTTEVGL
jgi:thiamine pyrophosphokinase